MIFVQALVTGPLVQVGTRYLLRSLEEGRWKTAFGSVEVDPGLICSFNSTEDRDGFLVYRKHQPPRADIPVVNEGEVLLFAHEEDVDILVGAEVLRRLNPEEIEKVIQQAQGGEAVSIPAPAPEEPDSDGDGIPDSEEEKAAKPKAKRKQGAK